MALKLCYLVIKPTFIALIADFVIWVIFALEIGGLYSFNEYNWKKKRENISFFYKGFTHISTLFTVNHL